MRLPWLLPRAALRLLGVINMKLLRSFNNILTNFNAFALRT